MSSSLSQANAANPSTCSPVIALVPAMEPSEPARAQPCLPPDTELRVKSSDNNAVAGQSASVKSDEKGFAVAGANPERMEKPAWTAPTKAIRGVRRGRPPLGRRSRGARLKLVNGYKEHNGWAAVNNGDATPHDGADQGASRGRARARGKNRGGRPRIHPLRGSGRATKRRRGDSDEDDGGTEKYDTDATENFSPLPAQSRSGRKIFKATTFTPVGIEATRGENLPGPGGGIQKKRRRRGGLNSVCKNCGRGPSPGRNMIVYCDDCGTAWHQHCHDPPVSPATVRAEQEQWFCADCETAREEKQRLVGKISAEGMSLAEKRRYLQTLSAHDLIFLLLHATSLHPELPILNSESSAAAGRGATAAVAAEEEMPDYYGFYPDIGSLPYPKAGNGVRLPPECDDIEILMDDDGTSFSHRWNWDSTTTTTTTATTTTAGAGRNRNEVPHFAGSSSSSSSSSTSSPSLGGWRLKAGVCF